MDNKTNCSLCRYCLYDSYKQHDFVCHNEHSENFGHILTDEDKKQHCKFNDFEPHQDTNMSVKEALEIMIGPGSYFLECYYKLPHNHDIKSPFVALEFTSNQAVAQWKDARLRLFQELMELKKKDGDFT